MRCSSMTRLFCSLVCSGRVQTVHTAHTRHSLVALLWCILIYYVNVVRCIRCTMYYYYCKTIAGILDFTWTKMMSANETMVEFKSLSRWNMNSFTHDEYRNEEAARERERKRPEGENKFTRPVHYDLLADFCAITNPTYDQWWPVDNGMTTVSNNSLHMHLAHTHTTKAECFAIPTVTWSSSHGYGLDERQNRHNHKLRIVECVLCMCTISFSIFLFH